MINTLLIILVIAITLVCVVFYYDKSRKATRKDIIEDEDMYNVEILVDKVKEKFNDILKTNLYEMNLTKDEFQKRMQNKSQLRVALKNCTYGDVNSKNYIKDYIRDILIKTYKIDENNINKILNFDNSKELNIQDKFEILMYAYKKKYGYRALEKILTKEHTALEYTLDMPKYDDNGQPMYIVRKDEIEAIYNSEVKKINKFEDKLNIVVQRIYQLYKGYSVVDEIRDMKIDGVSGGVSGIPSTFYQESDSDDEIFTSLPASYDSVWIFFKGKTIHLSFLSFGSEHELMRVCKNIYRYNNPGQLSESNGYKVNEMKDGSRVVVARPPFSESWVFFVRKFDSAENKEPEDLITDKNSSLVIGFIKWMITGCRIIAITGSQGSGKTTLLMSIVKFINPTYALRIQEMAFELHLRKLYPFRNILTFRETTTVSGQEGLDLQKKTDGTVNILGEVADAKVASWMIQMSLVASLFTMFTHHAKTTKGLVIALRNCLLQTGVFNNEKVAEKQVADVINFDIHMTKDINGHRYIQRITEVIPLLQDIDYPDDYKNLSSHEEMQDKFLDTTKEYYTRQTDRKIFDIRDIIIYDNGEYKAKNAISKKSYNAMLKNMTDKERICFNEFLTENWGVLYYEQ